MSEESVYVSFQSSVAVLRKFRIHSARKRQGRKLTSQHRVVHRSVMQFWKCGYFVSIITY